MKAILADVCLALGLLGMTFLQVGWIFWPALGDVMVLANTAFFFAVFVVCFYKSCARKT